jgi:hypothetical protein
MPRGKAAVVTVLLGVAIVAAVRWVEFTAPSSSAQRVRSLPRGAYVDAASGRVYDLSPAAAPLVIYRAGGAERIVVGSELLLQPAIAAACGSVPLGRAALIDAAGSSYSLGSSSFTAFPPPSSGRRGVVFALANGSACATGARGSVKRSAQLSFVCGAALATDVSSPRACEHDIVVATPHACGVDPPAPPPSSVCKASALAGGAWHLPEENIARSDARVTTWRAPDAPCRVFARRDFTACFSGRTLVFAGDSVTWQTAFYTAIMMAHCGGDAAAAPGVAPFRIAGANVSCAELRRLYETSAALQPASWARFGGAPALRGSSLSYPTLVLDGNVTIKALRWETLLADRGNGNGSRVVAKNQPLAWGFFHELLIEDPGDDVTVIFNVALHDMHYFDTREGYLREMAALLAELAAAPRWRDASARASGRLMWRSLTPTEAPTAHRIAGMRNPVDFFRALDAEVSAMWRAAGFPVIDLAGIVFHDAGNERRTLTTDSVHFTEETARYLGGYILDAACDLSGARESARG